VLSCKWYCSYEGILFEGVIVQALLALNERIYFGGYSDLNN
jgi:hypothetical protein